MDRPPDLQEPEPLTDEQRDDLRARGYRRVEKWIRPDDEATRMEAAVAEMRQIAGAEDAADLDLFVAGCAADTFRLIDEEERKAGLPSPLSDR